MRLLAVLVLVAFGGCDAGLMPPEPGPSPSLPDLAGRWTTSVALDYDAFPTMEIHIATRVAGGAWLELAQNGTVAGCLAARVDESGSISHYESPDHQDHHHATTLRELLAVRGTWTATATGAAVALASASRGSCMHDPTRAYDPKIVLGCQLVAGRVQCTAANHDLVGLGIRLEPPPTPHDPMTNPRGSSLILGRPGVTVRVTQHARDRAPAIELVDGEVPPIREADFVEPPRHPRN